MSEDDAWSPANPDGDLVPILEASLAAAKQQHPSGKDDTFTEPEAYASAPVDGALTNADRCDEDCPQAALYRLQLRSMVIEFCAHHHAKHFPVMERQGWRIIGTNDSLAASLSQEGM